MSNKQAKHIAIIMDGNGRWAQKRSLPRTAGHHQGIEACKRTVRAAGEMGLEYLTLFGFSSENWARPANEVNELMRLLRMYLRSETADLHRNNVKLTVIGERSELSKDIVDLIESAEKLTQGNDGLHLVIALNYGGRMDITKAATDMAKHFQDQGLEPSYENAEEYLPQFLMTKDMPAPDILIRTSGEKRISNFLLWQCAYSEFIFTDTLWPDFNEHDLKAALNEYGQRDRRYGAIKTV
ncbi:MAG: isoprenyl transferase [Pseudomonadota bacterium]